MSFSVASYVNGGTAPYGGFAKETGTLPSGVTVGADGTVSATGGATLGDSGTITLRVNDAALATAYSTPITIKVYNPFAATPAKGLALRVATASQFEAVKIPQHSMVAWRYAAFGSFGSGLFNKHYSANGAFVVASSGGHGHPKFFGDLVFDFDTMEWTYTACANPGVADTESPTPYDQMNGDPWYEMNSALPDNVPAPPHPYKNMQVIPPSKGGSSKGDMIWIGRSAISITGGGESSQAHSYNLVTHKWKRQSVSGGTYKSVETATVYDEVANRYYHITPNLQYLNNLTYLDGNNWAFKQTATFPKWGPEINGLSTSVWIQTGGGVRALMIVRVNRLFAVNLDAPASGFIEVAHTGDEITPSYSNPVLHEDQNVLYQRLTGDPGQRLIRWTPPSGNPITGTWNIDSITFGGDVIPASTAQYIDNNVYRTLMYLPALKMLGWASVNGVYLINP